MIKLTTPAGSNIGAGCRSAVAAIAAVLPITVAMDLQGPARTALAIAFVTTVPGSATLTRLSALDVSSIVALTVVASLAICAVAASGMIWLSAWHPLALLALLSAASIVTLLIDVRFDVSVKRRRPA
jgi:hypothetical protein